MKTWKIVAFAGFASILCSVITNMIMSNRDALAGYERPKSTNVRERPPCPQGDVPCMTRHGIWASVTCGPDGISLGPCMSPPLLPAPSACVDLARPAAAEFPRCADLVSRDTNGTCKPARFGHHEPQPIEILGYCAGLQYYEAKLLKNAARANF
jgi:hypothetical protein